MSEYAVINYSSEAGSVDLREIERPSTGPDDVIVEVGAVGVCGSDIHQWHSSHSWPVNYPVVLGHEFGGRIIELGERVEGWSINEMVVSETAAIINSDSPMSRVGLYNLDKDRKGFGYGVNGAMTKFVKVPSRCLHRIPDGVPIENAALTEPCCVAYNAVINNASIKPGDRVLVLGPGPIGILCGIFAKMAGADTAIKGLVSDSSRLEVAQKSYGLKALTEGADVWARDLDGLGADVVVDAAGVSESLKMAIDLVRPNGTIVKVGWGPKPIDFSLDPVVQKNVRIQGSFSHNWPVWEKVLGLMGNGSLDVSALIGEKAGLSQWKFAFEQMDKGKVVKSVLFPEN
ncbi:MAG: Zn-dependent alcohol dehydrogenase [Verrucomicrobiaceae bacterium TMED76]|nr:MAG: Zn-dependent alcohol dehydrogenase [Verrucomicrobiaceae bacterium TMED76]